MTPKHYLMTAMRLAVKYKRALEDVEQIRELATSAGAIRYDKLNVQQSPDGDRLADYMDRLTKAEERSIRLSEQYYAAYTKIRDQIDEIQPEIYGDILHARYIRGLKLWQIADEMGYSFDRMRHLHGMALAAFGRHFPGLTKVDT